MANRNSPQFPPQQDQIPQQMRIGIEVPLDFNMPELSELTHSPVAPDENNDNFFGLFYGVDVEVLTNWVDETLLMRSSIGYIMQETDITDDIRLHK